MAKREEVELPIALHNPRIARAYIARFEWDLPDPPKFVIVNFGERIWFSDMTDDQAVTAALLLFLDVDLPCSKRDRNLVPWDN